GPVVPSQRVAQRDAGALEDRCELAASGEYSGAWTIIGAQKFRGLADPGAARLRVDRRFLPGDAALQMWIDEPWSDTDSGHSDSGGRAQSLWNPGDQGGRRERRQREQ